jgi:hypothetical protein
MPTSKYFLFVLCFMCHATTALAQIYQHAPSTSMSYSDAQYAPVSNSMASRLLTGQFSSPKLMTLPRDLSIMNYTHVLISPGLTQPEIAIGVKKIDEVVALISFRFRQPGILSSTMNAGRRGDGAVLIETGSTGFRINPARIVGANDFQDIWCFIPSAPGIAKRSRSDAKAVCLYKLKTAGWIAVKDKNAFPNNLMLPTARAPNVMDPAIEALSFDQVPEKKLELRFNGWTSLGPNLKAYFDGNYIETIYLTKLPDNSLRLRLLDRVISFTRVNNRDSETIVSVAENSSSEFTSTQKVELKRLSQTLDESLASWSTYNHSIGYQSLNTQVLSDVSNPISNPSSAITVIPEQIIATQSRTPKQILALQRDLSVNSKNYGRTGDLFFRVDIDSSLHVVCSYQPDLTVEGNEGSSEVLDNRYCLEDSDDDNLYDTVWRKPTFAPGSRYNLLDLASPQKFAQISSVSFQATSLNDQQLRPDVLNLIYDGPIYFPVDTRPGLIQLTWRYGENQRAWPILALVSNFDATGSALLTT